MTTLIPKYDQGATGAVNRDINLKLAETVSVKDFGAVGDGVTDDSVAIANAIAFATTSVSTIYPTQLYFPNGQYLITQNNWIGANITTTYGGLSDFIFVGAGRTATTIIFKPSVANGTCYDQTLSVKGLIGVEFKNIGITFDNSANGSQPVHFIKSVSSAPGGQASQNFKLDTVTFTGVAGAILFNLGGTVNEDLVSCVNLRVVAFESIVVCTNLESLVHNFYSLDLINITGDVFSYTKGGSLGVYGCNAILSGTAGVDTHLFKMGGGTTSQCYYFNNVRTELRGANTRILGIVAAENNIIFDSCTFFANMPNGQAWCVIPIQHHASITFRDCILPIVTGTGTEGLLQFTDSTSGFDYSITNFAKSYIHFENCSQAGSRLVDMPDGWSNYDLLTAPYVNYRTVMVAYKGCAGISDHVEYGGVYRQGKTFVKDAPKKLVARGTSFPYGNGTSAVVSPDDFNIVIPLNNFVTEIVVMRSAKVTAATSYQIEFIDTAERNTPGSGIIFGATVAGANNTTIAQRVNILRQFTGTLAQRTIWCRMSAGFTLTAGQTGDLSNGGVWAETL